MLAFTAQNGKLNKQEKTIPRRKNGWAVLRVRLAGICNTDVEILRGYHDFHGTPGHEFVGEVVDCAERGWNGRRVVGEINVSCEGLGRRKKCDFCKRGIATHCAHRRVLGIIRQDGAFAEYLTLPIGNLHKVPDGVSDEQAVFTEPLAAACEILEQVKIREHREVAVLGDGKLAQLIARVLHSAGPRVTMFGDSIASSLEYVPEAREFLGQGLDLRLELSPCRKLVPPGCPYQGARPPSVLDIVESSSLAQLGNIVIVNVGYNDPANNYETDMAQVANALVAASVGHIIWVTLREQSESYRQINEIIRTQAPRWPQMQVAEWESTSRGRDWFNDDGLHLNAAGALGLAKLLRPYVLAACGSACESAGPSPAQAPRNVLAPVLRGTPIVGRLLTCRQGSWTGTRPIVFSYRWLRNGKVIAGARGSTRRLLASDRRRLVACRVWAGNASGASPATSKAVLVRAAP